MKQWFLAAGIALSAWGCASQSERTAEAQSPASDELYASLPFKMDKVQQPVFPDYSRSVDEFGAKADGVTLNTEAINAAIREVSEKGGGTVVVPAGIWLSGPIEILSNVNLHLERNALLYFTADHTQYPIVETSFEGLETRRCQAPISARNAENIAVTGEGVIDGNGDTWRPVKQGKLTSSQWKKLVASGGVLDAKGTTWYPSEGSLKGAMEQHTRLAASGAAEFREMQEGAARRGDVQELSELVPASAVVRGCHHQPHKRLQSVVFSERRRARLGVVQPCAGNQQPV